MWYAKLASKQSQLAEKRIMMAEFTGLDNKSIVAFAVASGLENFEINGNKIFDDSGKYYVSQKGSVVDIVERKTGRGEGHKIKVVFSIIIQENLERDFTN